MKLNGPPLLATVFHDLGVEEGNTYEYELKAVDALGQESAGVTVSAKPWDGVPPAAPVGVRAVPGPDATQATVVWEPNSEGDLAGYNVYGEDPAPGGGTELNVRATVGPGVTRWTETGLTIGQTYAYAVEAFDARNNSAMSASALVRPRVAVPAAPEVWRAEKLLGLGGGSAILDYRGAGGDASQYSSFRVYRKEQGLPEDQWELVFTAPVAHFAGVPEEGIPPRDTFNGEYVDQWLNRCRVTEYLVSGIDNAGDETEDSYTWRAEWVLLPEIPELTVRPNNKLRFDARGFVGCAAVGNGFTVTQWVLTAWGNASDPNATQQTQFSPDQGWVEVDLPPSGQTWSYSLSAEVQNLYETVDPNHPYLLNTFVSQDICVTSEGAIDPNDGACPDLDLSRRLPPGSCETNCTPAGGGGPGSWEEAWQDVPMRMMPSKKLRGASLDIPAPHKPEAAPGEAGWRIARGRRIERRPGSTAADVAMDNSRTMLGATSSVATSDVALQIEPMQVGFADELRPLDPLAPITTIDAPVREGFPSRPAEAKRAFERVPPTAGPSGGGWPALAERVDYLSALGIGAVMEAGGLNWLPPLLITGTSTKHFRWEFFSSDHLGSVRVVTDPSGAKIWETKYLPYGEEVAGLAGSPSNNTHRFTGHERDGEDGLDYMLARYYGSSLGRFQSPDPGVDVDLADPQSWNMYTYVRNNPLNRTDPDGRRARVDGDTKKERKANFKKLKENLKKNGATKKELRSLKLNKKTGEVTQKGGAIKKASPAFGSFQNAVSDDNMATVHFVRQGGSSTANNGNVIKQSDLLARGGALTTLDVTGDTNPVGGVDVEVWVAEGGLPGGVAGASGGMVRDPENLMAAHETREAYEWMSNPTATYSTAHQIATDFENQLRSSLGFALRAP